MPDKRIYVVNGQIELMPSERQAPLVSAIEDIEVFKKQNGLIVSTIELFKTIKEKSDNYSLIKQRIKKEIGIFFANEVSTG